MTSCEKFLLDPAAVDEHLGEEIPGFPHLPAPDEGFQIDDVDLQPDVIHDELAAARLGRFQHLLITSLIQDEIDQLRIFGPGIYVHHFQNPIAHLVGKSYEVALPYKHRHPCCRNGAGIHEERLWIYI